MENKPSPTVTQSLDGVLSSQSTEVIAADNAQQAYALEQPSQPAAPDPEYIIMNQKRTLGSRLRMVGFVLLVLLLIGGGLLFIRRNSGTATVQLGKFPIVHISLATIASNTSGDTAQTLKVNGRLQVANSLVLTPTNQPGSPIVGQIYYDRQTNQIAYYNGQAFVPVGQSIFNNTTVIGGGAGSGVVVASVLLQAASPGVQQTGNFNVNGKGIVGSLETTVISSAGQSLFVNPTAVNAPSQPGGISATLGSSTIGGSTTPAGWNNVLSATKVTMGDTGGNIKSISVNFVGGSASSHVQLAIYDDDGDIPSKPGALLAASTVGNLVPNGLTTLNVPSIGLSPNTTYWLAVNTDDTVTTRTYIGGNKVSCFISSSFGFMPDPFSSFGCFFDNSAYTIFATYITSSGSAGISKAEFSLSPTGQAVFQNSEDSGTAFQVQNAAGTATIFNVDTISGRVAIGKASAAYRLDIAGGDINLSNGRSVRFGGIPALSVSGSGTTTSIGNFISGGEVSAQADNFVVQDANATHQNLSIDSNGATIFSNRIDSTAGFQIQNAAGTSLLRADTTGMQLYVGNPAGSATPVLLFLANKNTADDPMGAAGAEYFNSTLASFRCFYSGFWHNCADIEPQHGFSLYDEFIGGQTSFTGQIGSLGWTAIAIGANGSLALNPAIPTPSGDRPGVLRVRTPAVLNQGTTLLFGDGVTGSMIIAKDNDLKTAVAVGAANGQVLRIGIHNETSTTAQPVSGVWWEADPSVSPNWRYCYGNGAAATCAASAVVISANTWVTLEIRVTAAGSAAFVINNTPFSITGTIDTTNNLSPALTCFSSDGNARDCFWDYFQLTGTANTMR